MASLLPQVQETVYPRRLEPELMDDPGLDPAEHRQALRGLARINTLSGAGRSVWREVRPMLRGAAQASLVDVAAGSGDVTLAVAGLAQSDGVALTVRAVDISPEAGRVIGERAAAAGLTVSVDVRNALTDGLGVPEQSADVAMCSLFLHHLKDNEVVSLLASMKRTARRGVVVSDLRRCRTGLLAAQAAGRLLTRSRVVRVDAVLSVRAAFTIAEMRQLAERAGLAGAAVRPVWPFRMMLTWERA